MEWTLEAIAQDVQGQMPERRWQHTLGVIETSVELATRFGADVEKARLAATLHDVAKYWPVERQRSTLLEAGETDPWLIYDKPLWHAPAGAVTAKAKYGVTDPEVLDAIRYHTSGRVDMTLLDKVVCLADYIEPGRDFPGVERLRELARDRLEEALIAGFDGTIRLLLEQGAVVFPLTLESRNALIRARHPVE